MEQKSIQMMKDTDRTPGAVIRKDGIHFGCYSDGDRIPSLLLYEKGSEIVTERIPFPASDYGDSFYSMKLQIDPHSYEYNFCIEDEVFTDPYARKICGRKPFGTACPSSPHALRGGFCTGTYRWKDDHLPRIPYNEGIMYHLHIRGFTQHPKSGVRKKGTFAGAAEKIPYLRSLGINQVRLMPVYEFEDSISLLRDNTPAWQKNNRMTLPAADLHRKSEPECRTNYWGYGSGFYMAPKAAYAFSDEPDRELKDMIGAFHRSNIEVILEFAFTDQTDMEQIIRCLTMWAEEYHVDGFAVMARESVVAELACIPLFQSRKLIAGWYPDSVRTSQKTKLCRTLAQSNDGFMNVCRQALRGDGDMMEAFGGQMRAGSQEIAQINYITNHDGFTLADLVSYDHKHNLANQERDRDGTDYNYSWNCGVEGSTKKRDILALRMRQRKNAFAMLLFAQGTPMLLAGDEFGNSQEGNNNPYCHDSELTWLDWNKGSASKELTEFVRQAVAFRKAHQVLHQKREITCTDLLASGYPDLSFHGIQAWYGDFEHCPRHLGLMYCGRYAEEEGFLYIACNFHWDEQEFALPPLPGNGSWYKVMDTSLKNSFLQGEEQIRIGREKSVSVGPRTVVVLEER